MADSVVATAPVAAVTQGGGTTTGNAAPAVVTTVPAAFTPPAGAPAAVPTPTLLDGIKPPAAEAAKPDAAAKVETPKTEPVKHDYSKLEIPKDSLLPAAHKEKIAAFASKHSLSPEVAQELAKSQSADLKEYVDSQVKAYEGVKAKWADELKANPKFGGERLQEYNKGATEVLNKYGSPALMKMLQESGYAYKVEVAELLSNIYTAMKPDKMVMPGATGAGPTKDNSPDAVAKRMFNKSNHV